MRRDHTLVRPARPTLRVTLPRPPVNAVLRDRGLVYGRQCFTGRDTARELCRYLLSRMRDEADDVPVQVWWPDRSPAYFVRSAREIAGRRR